jgi:hypothetical protein
MKDRKDRATPRPGGRDPADNRAGDEGLEENKQGSSSQRPRSGNVQVDDVRDADSISRTTERHRNAESGSSSEAQGGQKGGSRGSEQDTGHSEDADRLREDDSISGSQGRQGKSGSRQGRPSSTNERPSEQSKRSSRDDVDRTVM